VWLVNYEDGTDTDVEQTVEEADLSGNDATVTVEEDDFDNVEAPDAGDYTVEASVDNFDEDADVDPIERTSFDQITVTDQEGDGFDVLEITDIGGNANNWDFVYEISNQNIQSLEFNGYEGDNTEGTPDDNTTVDNPVFEGERAEGTESIQIGGAPDEVTAEAIALDDQDEKIERCVVTFSDRDDFTKDDFDCGS